MFVCSFSAYDGWPVAQEKANDYKNRRLCYNSRLRLRTSRLMNPVMIAISIIINNDVFIFSMIIIAEAILQLSKGVRLREYFWEVLLKCSARFCKYIFVISQSGQRRWCRSNVLHISRYIAKRPLETQKTKTQEEEVRGSD